MFHKIKSVQALPGYTLQVQFAHGSTKQYRVAPLFHKWPAFRWLQEHPERFVDVSVDLGGYGVSWNDDLDLSCDELYENGEPVQTPFDGLLAFSDASQLWGLNESTLRKAISYGKLKNGTDVQKFGKQWVIAEDALRREYGAPKNKAGE